MVDIGIIVGISLFIVIGFRDGFSKKVFGFFGVWGGLIAAIKLMGPAADIVSSMATFDVETAVTIAILTIFVLCVILMNIFFRWFGRTGDETLTIRNRLLGSLLGACQGLIAVSTLLIILTIFDSPSDDDKKGSILYTKMVRVAPFVFDYSTRWMPDAPSFNETMGAKIEKFKTQH